MNKYITEEIKRIMLKQDTSKTNQELTIVKTQDAMLTVNAVECGFTHNVAVKLGKGFDEITQHDELCLKLGNQMYARGNKCECCPPEEQEIKTVAYPEHIANALTGTGDNSLEFDALSAEIIKESNGPFESIFETDHTKLIRRGMAQIFSEANGERISLLSTPNYTFTVGSGFSGNADVIIDTDELSPEIKAHSKRLLHFFISEIENRGLKDSLNSSLTITDNNDNKHRFSIIALDERFLAPDLQELRALYDENADLLPSEFMPTYVLVCEIPNGQQPDTNQDTIH